jgi:hypothetical protein
MLYLLGAVENQVALQGTFDRLNTVSIRRR